MAAQANGRGAVVVTGTSTGIGRATALHLDSLGFRVFTGVRKEADGERLAADASDRLTPLIIDVTDQPSIDAAAGKVTGEVGDGGLAGLVNNAGMSNPAPLEVMPIDELRRQLEVNTIGQIAVTQAFLPLIRKAKGRIVNVTSVGGRVASPFLGAYSASKFALEALTDSLRQELHPWGIHVSAIEPGAIETSIWETGRTQSDEIIDGLPPEKRELYAKQVEGALKTAAELEKRAIPPRKVAQRIEHALTSNRPKTRYVVGTDARVQIALAGLLPDRGWDAVLRRIMRD